MKTKLFYEDAYIQTFSTTLKKQEKDDLGQTYVILNETAFYPTGGGQPFDTGTLNNISVLNVEEIDGEIRHYMESPLPNTSSIDGQINWSRRFDHMQQHAGQHILSAAFEELFKYETVSFHLGQEILTIDLAVDDLTEEEAEAAEKLANNIILENRPIETKWVSENELSQYHLRKQPTVTENIRLVIIPNFDYNGCGGTHPSSTGQVGSIKILDWEKQRKKIRIQFVCGNRVLKQFHKKQKVILELTKLLNAPEVAMVDSLTRLLDTVKCTDKDLEEAHNQLLQYEGKELISEQSCVNNRAVISKVFQNRSLKELQKLARSIISDSEEVIVLLVSENESQLQVVAARGSKIDLSMKSLLSELLSTINGKGGGNEAFAQGGGEMMVTGEQLLENGLMAIQN
jgi:alanyl-tRNA synthetase